MVRESNPHHPVGYCSMMTKPDGSPMTKQEAIATNILNLAMKGDVKAAQYIQNIQMRAKIMKKK